MDRKKRIRIVVVAAIDLLALFVAFVGAPLVAVSLWPESNASDDVGAFMRSFNEAAHTAQVANTISLVSLLVAGVCTIYLLVVLAVWFIGPSADNCERNV